jgi:hypothetical protein
MRKLKTETDTPEMEKRIGDAFDARFPNLRGNCNVDFEHGQWWVTHILSGAQWSVVDASGGSSVNGFDFEQVTEGDDA